MLNIILTLRTTLVATALLTALLTTLLTTPLTSLLTALITTPNNYSKNDIGGLLTKIGRYCMGRTSAAVVEEVRLILTDLAEYNERRKLS